MKVVVKRVVYINYEYPFNEQHVGNDTMDKVVEFEKQLGPYDAVNYGDFEEDVTVTFVED